MILFRKYREKRILKSYLKKMSTQNRPVFPPKLITEHGWDISFLTLRKTEKWKIKKRKN